MKTRGSAHSATARHQRRSRTAENVLTAKGDPTALVQRHGLICDRIPQWSCANTLSECYRHGRSGCFRLERLPAGVCIHRKTPPCHGRIPTAVIGAEKNKGIPPFLEVTQFTLRRGAICYASNDAGPQPWAGQ